MFPSARQFYNLFSRKNIPITSTAINKRDIHSENGLYVTDFLWLLRSNNNSNYDTSNSTDVLHGASESLMAIIQQKQQVYDYIKSARIEVGDVCYVVSMKWWQAWRFFIEKNVGTATIDDFNGSYDVDKDNDYPGPINTISLCEKTEQWLRKDVVIGQHCVILPSTVWVELSEFYGIVGPTFARYAIDSIQHHDNDGDMNKETVTQVFIEVHLVTLFYGLSGIDGWNMHGFSLSDTLEFVRAHVCAKLLPFTNEKHCILWQYRPDQDGISAIESMNSITSGGLTEEGEKSASSHLKFPSLNRTLHECGFEDGTKLFLTVKKGRTWKSDQNSGGWGKRARMVLGSKSNRFSSHSLLPSPRALLSSVSLSGDVLPINDSIIDDFNDTPEVDKVNGLTGLTNLGNTCWLNAVIQCISHTTAFTDFLVNNHYVCDINRHNPIGSGGVFIEELASLIRLLWTGKLQHVKPRNFRRIVSRRAPYLDGLQQHDAQEFLSFMMDAVHEDLNRCKEKQYIEDRENNGRLPSVLAAEAWANYLQRNDSIVIDLFHGQLMSTLTCPSCSHVAQRFDPFMYLTVPIPDNRDRCMLIHFVTQSRELTSYDVKVPVSGTVKDLIHVLSNLSGVPIELLMLTEMYRGNIYRTFEKLNLSLDTILESSILYTFELDTACKDLSEGVFYAPLVYKCSDKRNFGVPAVIKVRHLMTYGELYDICKCIINQNRSSSEDDLKCTESAEKMGWTLVEKDDESSLSPSKPMFRILLVQRQVSHDLSLLNDRPLKFGRFLSFIAEFEQRDHGEGDQSTTKITMNQKYDKKKNESVTLEECLSAAFEKEVLSESEAWYCPNCKQHRENTTKSMDIWSIPEILIIHLKRFSATEQFRKKLDVPVSIPLEGLDMTQYIKSSPPLLSTEATKDYRATLSSEKQKSSPSMVRSLSSPSMNAQYDLYAVVDHVGVINSGHYTATCRIKDGTWYKFDDTIVSAADLGIKNISTGTKFCSRSKKRLIKIFVSSLLDREEAPGFQFLYALGQAMSIK